MDAEIKKEPLDQLPRSGKGEAPLGRAFNIIKTVLVWLLVVCAVAMMVFTIVSVSTFDRNDRELFGHKAFIVRSDSMSATDFKAGDLILVKEVDPATLEAGDVIAYRSTAASNFGETVTHKIRAAATTADGEPAFITYGTTTGIDDDIPVTYENVQGKYQGKLAGVGTFFTFLKTTPGYICCILLPFLLLIIAQGVSTVRLYQKYKRQQQREFQLERARIEADRAENQRMLRELQKMRLQMGLPPEKPEMDPLLHEPMDAVKDASPAPAKNNSVEE